MFYVPGFTCFTYTPKYYWVFSSGAKLQGIDRMPPAVCVDFPSGDRVVERQVVGENGWGHVHAKRV